METVRKIQANCVYVFEGICSANTHFVENKRESGQFLKFISRYLGDYINVLDFEINKKGWTIIVRTKSSTIVEKHYEKRQVLRNKLDKSKRTFIWDIISNAIRLMRSHFTRWTNKQRNRTGNASLRVFRRYLFTCLEEAKAYVSKVRNREIEMEQQNPRYRANSNHYDEDGRIAANVDHLSSSIYRKNRNFRGIFGNGCLKMKDYLENKLEKWIKRTCYAHGVAYEEVYKAEMRRTRG